MGDGHPRVAKAAVVGRVCSVKCVLRALVYVT